MQKKRGRPAKYGKAMKDYYIRLAESHAETFKTVGDGNMSAGARRLADEWEAAQKDGAGSSAGPQKGP